MRVPGQVYDFSDADIDAVTGQLRELLEQRQFLSLGDHVERFEEAFADRHDAPFATATNSGTAALEGILRAVDVTGGEVIVPTNTFAATAFAVIRAGARPVFADILDDLTLDAQDAARRVTPDTRAVVTVHIGGLISPSTLELVELCQQRQIPLVEDAAHAHGSAYQGRHAGSFGVAAAFSFFSTKVMTTGEGGMVVTADAGIAESVRLLRDQAKVAGGNHHETIGHNWRMAEVQAMLGNVQLARLDAFITERQRVAARYDTQLRGIPGLEPIAVPHGAHHNFYKYIAIVDGVAPEDVKAAMRDNDVSMSGYVYELPLHEQPAFADYAQGALPVAEDLARRHICPPIYPSLTDEQVDHVATSLRNVLSSKVGSEVTG